MLDGTALRTATKKLLWRWTANYSLSSQSVECWCLSSPSVTLLTGTLSYTYELNSKLSQIQMPASTPTWQKKNKHRRKCSQLVNVAKGKKNWGNDWGGRIVDGTLNLLYSPSLFDAFKNGSHSRCNLYLATENLIELMKCPTKLTQMWREVLLSLMPNISLLLLQTVLNKMVNFAWWKYQVGI